MKAAGLPLLFLAATAVTSATEESPPTTAAPSKTSARLTQEIRGPLPKFTPPAVPVLDQPKETDGDPDVLRLPKFTVKEKRPPTHDPDVWLTEKSIQQKAMAAYKQSLTDFEWALNGWYIPIFGTSPSARARAAYASQKKMSEQQRIHRLFSAIATVDAEGAQELERERVKMEQSEYWQSRPAGDGRSK